MTSCPNCGCGILERRAGQPRIGMTPKEKKLLAFLVSYQAEHGFFPTYLEMAAAMGAKTKSGVHRSVAMLCEKHYITRLPGRPRAMAVVPL